MATLTTIVSFDNTNGDEPRGSLNVDANGDLFGTTRYGGASGDGTVFEITKTATGYANTPTVLVSFNGTDGANPVGSLIADANGDLFGTAQEGGPSSEGTVFEIAKTATGYAGTPTVLVSFNGNNGFYPGGSLLADVTGDLFGTTIGGGSGADGTVFEITDIAGKYSSAPITVANFSYSNGKSPDGSLITDANGDLLGTIAYGGTSGDGAVFEVTDTLGTYASTPTLLVNFNTNNEAEPSGSLIADANGDLFGTTAGASAAAGTVFEILKTASGYASTPIVLANFNGAPIGDLIADADGNLFGTEYQVGGEGMLFEIPKTANGYSATPIVLVNFNTTNGAEPSGSLIADANGDLFGTTDAGGANLDGTVFEVVNSGYQVACFCRGTHILTENGEIAVEELAIGDRVVTLSGAADPIRWIGRRAYAGRFLAANPGVRPIRFLAGSLGSGLPRQDLAVSPKHAMFLDGVLVPAEHLVNGITIIADHTAKHVEYFHIELETHEVLFAEGAPTESFVEDGTRAIFNNFYERAALYADYIRGPAIYFAPRIEEGYELEIIRQRLAPLRDWGRFGGCAS